MLHHYKISLLALAAFISTAVFAETGPEEDTQGRGLKHGFYVEFDQGGYGEDLDDESTVFAQFCSDFRFDEDASKCKWVKLDNENPTFVKFFTNHTVYLSSLKIKKGWSNDESEETLATLDSAVWANVINFSGPYDDCTEDLGVRFYSTANGVGYPFLVITYDNEYGAANHGSTVLNCDNGNVIWAGKRSL